MAKKKQKKINKRKINLRKTRTKNGTNAKMFLFRSSQTRVDIFRRKRYENARIRSAFEVIPSGSPTSKHHESGLKSKWETHSLRDRVS